MQSKQLLLLAVLMIVASVVCLFVPVHPLMNGAMGPAVLGGIGILAGVAGFLVRRQEGNEAAPRRVSSEEVPKN
jgi:hypothetical protein